VLIYAETHQGEPAALENQVQELQVNSSSKLPSVSQSACAHLHLLILHLSLGSNHSIHFAFILCLAQENLRCCTIL